MDDSDRPSRDDLASGLRFVHEMAIESRIEQTALGADVAAIKALLVERGAIAPDELEARRRQILDEEFEIRASRRFPTLGDPADKYAIESPDIPCDELLELCRAACCNLDFSLSIQDLDEGVIRWKYGEPYVNAQDPATGKCAHFAGTGCGVYEQRPSTCRRFDCRQDPRIWKDYERRIPSEHLSTLAPVPVIPGS